MPAMRADDLDDFDPDLDELETLSNSVLDLIESGHLDEAEAACRELTRRWPDQMDGIERMASVLEARGRTAEAVERYRECIAFIDAHPDGFDEESKQEYRDAIARLERPR